MSGTEGNQPQYKPGDIANGHRLTNENTWEPVGDVAPAVAGSALGVKKAARKWFMKKRFIIPAAVLLVFIFAAIVSPKKAADAGNNAPAAASVGTKTAEAVEEKPVDVAVPDTATQTAANGTATLTNLGFKVPAVEDPEAIVSATTPAAGTSIPKGSTVTLTVVVKPKLSLPQQNAVGKAESYLKFAAFSRSGLIHQLEFEGFSTDEATFGVDYLATDWNVQAAAKAKSYLDMSSFSRESLYDQLIFEGFSDPEANAGLAGVGY